jgi:hypothetical protein
LFEVGSSAVCLCNTSVRLCLLNSRLGGARGCRCTRQLLQHRTRYNHQCAVHRYVACSCLDMILRYESCWHLPFTNRPLRYHVATIRDDPNQCTTAPFRLYYQIHLIHRLELYVGNTVDTFMTIRANFATLCEDKALNGPHVRNRLPETIQDSMLLTSMIGQKYIWIDRLCIIQDDNKHKTTQLSDMASIYVNAFLTIVAAEGKDDTFGVRDITADRLPWSSSFHQIDFASTCRLITTPKFARTKYDTRGWTLQERMLLLLRVCGFSPGWWKEGPWYLLCEVGTANCNVLT